MLAQFRALHELMRASPKLLVVVSHDRDQRARLLAAGALHEGARAVGRCEGLARLRALRAIIERVAPAPGRGDRAKSWERLLVRGGEV